MLKLATLEFVFTENSKVKSRPVLVLTKPYGKHKICLVSYITSKSPEGLATEVVINPSSANKLKKNSVIKLHKLMNVQSGFIKKELGVLTPNEEKEVKSKIKMLFDL